ncbi:hypothetical protein FRE64_01345 [Euhalothece natronophila Z-M001]|uniref:DUF4164 domain-containing protein n=1 Tax=Euhalothece natronophila Z-M001 TaxID=522448 RepID=A0A5B8NK50_9CHRO|nr:hypothetical protein [Euhalothece natronophila]QDZ38705.1 hypothetical protein FRE64_01345 [Euhalothece natronophila Z-M001]
MATDIDFTQILERLEQKIDAQAEKLQSIDTRLARMEEKNDGLSNQLEKIEGNIDRQDNRLWTYLATTTVTLLGSLLAILGRFLLFPNQ